MATRPITLVEKQCADEMLAQARAAMKQVEDYDQARVDRLCRAIGWAITNEKTFTRLAYMGVEESELGDPASRVSKRFKVMGILRDVLRQKSVGIIEEIPEKGIVKYGKPVGVVASIIPTTNPDLTPPGVGLFALKCRDAVIFSPHPRSKKTTFETVRIMREVLKREGAPPDLFQCVENPSIPLSQYLMSICDLVQATGGKDMVKAAYSSGKPSFGVGAGNSTMVIDETADIAEAARNTRLSKTSDYGSGCSADGNLVIESSIYEKLVAQLIREGGYLASPEEKQKLLAVLWDSEGHRTSNTVAISAQKIAAIAGFEIPADRTFIMVEEQNIGKEHFFSSEKLCVVLALFKYSGFENALKLVEQIYEVGGKGHSCGIYSFDDDSENIHLKHYMNVTWVSRPIPEDRPTEQELFGEFYDTETF
ncbi:MAG: aldehyde dehydrogenase family protein [Chloroflexi bacterium]|nr:aldehyde dehydrogenase family protein [Chloroflexota bacterium]